MLDKDFYIKNGLIFAVVSIAYLMITYIIGVSFMASFWNMGLSLVVSLGLMIYMGMEVRKANGGYMSFGEAFKSIYVVYALGAFLYVLFNYVLATVIDPALPGKIADASMEMAMRMMENFDVPEEAMEESFEQFEEQREEIMKGFTPIGVIKNYFVTIAIGAIGVVIAAAITKKSNPNPFQEVNG